MNAFDAAEKEGRTADLQAALTALFDGENASSNKETTSISAGYLRVVVAL